MVKTISKARLESYFKKRKIYILYRILQAVSKTELDYYDVYKKV